MLLRYARHLLGPLLVLATTSCAPSYLLGVRPAAARTFLATGQPGAAATADSIALRLTFLGYEPEWLVFDAEYYNASSQPVTINPTDFAYAPLREVAAAGPAQRVLPGELVPAARAAASQYLAWPDLPAAPLAALDPEPSIARLRDDAEREAARASRPDWVGLALFAVALGTDLASATHRSETPSRAQARAVLHDVAWTYSAVSTSNRVRHAVTADALALRAEQLGQYALRRGQLLPGQQVRGYVYLPRFDQADGLRVLAPVGRQQVALDFVQTHQRR